MQGWYKTVRKERWADFASVRRTFGNADLAGRCVVFNIGGNKYRLIAAVHYQKRDKDGKIIEGRVYIRNVLTHREYDKGAWKTATALTHPRSSPEQDREHCRRAGTPGCGPSRVARYMELVAKFPLRPLRSERDLDRATKIVNALAIRGNLSRGEQDYLDVLTDLVEAYERDHHPIPDLSGPDMLRHLLEERGVSHAEAAREMGMAPSTISEILRGKRRIGCKHMEAFARYFRVSPAVFLREVGTGHG